MSDETILSGYCRVLDQSRMVTVEWEGQEPSGRRSAATAPASTKPPVKSAKPSLRC
ncbi:MAG: hypothetical protein ACLU9S_14965 [Oscillospiraceae bacterium]